MKLMHVYRYTIANRINWHIQSPSKVENIYNFDQMPNTTQRKNPTYAMWSDWIVLNFWLQQRIMIYKTKCNVQSICKWPGADPLKCDENTIFTPTIFFGNLLSSIRTKSGSAPFNWRPCIKIMVGWIFSSRSDVRL